MWLYGSGFPKSHNIGKAVDKIQGNEREVVGEMKGAATPGSTFTDENGRKFNSEYIGTKGQSEWEGWGTALKPANEPICVARKPLSEGTVAENVLKWGTGGINIDGCRVGYVDENDFQQIKNKANKNIKKYNNRDCIDGTWGKNNTGYRFDVLPDFGNSQGRFPANIILDEIAGELLDEQSRFFYQAKVSKAERNMGLDGFEDKDSKKIDFPEKDYLGSNGSIRTNKHTTTKNSHPTVKPINLMAYLCRLVTPANGIVLDPFMGSGSTGISALLEGFRFVGMEMDKEYFKIAEARINSYEEYRKFIKK
jgi:site-specific DNA-methyltransferase (adenine-specific)